MTDASASPLPDLATTAPLVLLEDTRAAKGDEPSSHLFWQPERLVICERGEELPAALAAIDAARGAGLYAAGWVAFESGYFLEPRLQRQARLPANVPLLWFGLFRKHAALTPVALARWWRTQVADDTADIADVGLNMSRAEYVDALARIRRYIEAGDTYQVNFTLKYRLRAGGNLTALYRKLRENQPVEYGALIRTGAHTVMSFSPELFFRKAGTRLTSKPMKGTAPRGYDNAQDAARAQALVADAKSRAENVMIVDLLRSDLGRIARAGTVTVPTLFEVERYRTVLQMTSTVAAQIDADTPFSTLLRKLFPCGSVCGAPKIRTLEIVRELEREPRGVYTGAIGFVAPNNDMCFNVAIRTLSFGADERGEMGIGSGVVYDSDIDAEYRECLLKGKFVTDAQPAFVLIETILWDGRALVHVADHLARLQASSRYFDFAYDRADIEQRLHASTAGLQGPQRVRLTLARDGDIALTTQAVAPEQTPWRVAVSLRPVDPADPFLYHKTSNRAWRDAELASALRAQGADEILFLNTRGEVTEGSRSNLVAVIAGEWFTPPVACGLLPGTFRQRLLANPRPLVRERVLSLAEVASAERIFLCNAIRGLVPATLVPPPYGL